MSDLGLGSVLELAQEETERRWQATTSQWPMVSAVFNGVTRDAFMGRHRANHVNIAYTPSEEGAKTALAAKAAMLDELGFAVHLCGTVEWA